MPGVWKACLQRAAAGLERRGLADVPLTAIYRCLTIIEHDISPATVTW